jgi:hypothetical protein
MLERSHNLIQRLLLVLHAKIMQYFNGSLLGSSGNEPEQKYNAERKAAAPLTVDSIQPASCFHFCCAGKTGLLADKELLWSRMLARVCQTKKWLSN